MKINEVEISGFKGIPQIIINPKQINLLVGKNNTGKTSILEAINSVIESNINSLQIKYHSDLSSVININKKELITNPKEDIYAPLFNKIN